MKLKKSKIFQIVVAVLLVISSCFFTGNIQATGDATAEPTVDNNGEYFENNLYIDNIDIINNKDGKGEKPIFVPSRDEEGSDLSDGATEGQVWTNKKIEIIDEKNGIFKVTLQALGFKYREVGTDNKKTNTWKNPLAEGSTLTISEEIDSNFHVVNNEKYKNTLNSYVGLDENKITYGEQNGVFTLSFNANDVNIATSNGGTAFDVETSFYVQINNNVIADTYFTIDATSRFKPATDNFYYYEWGKIESKASIVGLNWNNSGDGWTAITHGGTWTLIGSNDETFTLDMESRQIWNKNQTTGTYTDAVLQQHGIDSLTITVEFNGEGSNREVYLTIVVNYNDGSNVTYQPMKQLGGNGGVDKDEEFSLGIVIDKTDPQWRPDFTPDEDNYINEQFDNHGMVSLVAPSIDNVETKKTATLIDWDKRTYRIDLFARSTLVQQAKPVDIMFALDFSGSMPWLLTEPSQTISYGNLNTSNNRTSYSVVNGVTMGTIDKWSEFQYFVKDSTDNEYKPIAYFDFDGREDDGWYAIKSAGANSDNDQGSIVYNSDLKVESRTPIYVKGSNKTKLEELLSQTQAFIDSLAISSPNSTVGFSFYAGVELETTDLTSVSTLKTDGVRKAADNISLTGNTAQGVGIDRSQGKLQSGSNKDKYIILFTDGAEQNGNNQIAADTAAKKAKYAGITIYTVGLANQYNIEKMREQLTSWSSGEGYYFPTSNYEAFEEAFNSIFNDLVGSIKNVTIVDTIDERFQLAEGEKQRLEAAGITVNGNTITWNISELRYYDNIENGLNLYIEIVAKDDFLGGNYIPTNVSDKSYVEVEGEQKQLGKPVVNVKTKIDVNNGEETYFLGEEIDPVNFIDILLNGSNVELNDDQKEALISGTQLEIPYSYGLTNDNVGTIKIKYEPVTTDSELEKHNASKTGEKVEEYKLTVNYEVKTVDDRKSSINGTDYIYTDEESFIKETHDDCNHTTDENLKNKTHIAVNAKDNGSYVINVVSGTINVKKTVDKISNGETYGNPIFTFKLEGTTVTGKHYVEYKTVKFDAETGLSLNAEAFDNLEKGVYTLTELDTSRYELDDLIIDGDSTTALYTENADSIVFYVGCSNKITATDETEIINTLKVDKNAGRLENKEGNVEFKNKLINEEFVSDTDVVTNKFEIDSDGNVHIVVEEYNGNK